jgi:hypothetical protein
VVRLAPEDRPLVLTGRPKVVIASSGMLVGGPSVRYARHFATHPECAIFLTGYQDEESPGRRLLELKTGDIWKFPDGQEVVMACKVARYNLSAHADQVQLCQFTSVVKPSAIALVHGEPVAIQTLRSKLVMKQIVWTPKNGQTIDCLAAPEWLSEYRKHQLDTEFERFEGRIEPSPDGRVWLSFDAALAQSEPWRQFLAGYPKLQARFMGKRLIVRGQAAEEEESDGETGRRGDGARENGSTAPDDGEDGS